MGQKLKKLSERNYMYCDGCSPKSVRNIHRKNKISQGNACYKGTINDAVRFGWVVSKQGHTLCPSCIIKSLNEMFHDNQLDVNELKHYCINYSCE